MTPDRANCSFLASVAIAALSGAIVLCGAVGAVLAPLLLARPAQGGSSFPALAFVAAVAVGLGLGGRSLGRQVLASNRLARRVRQLARPVPDDLVRAASDAGLTGRIVLVDAPEPFSFVYGALNPRVAVSCGLLRNATSCELRAVLEHERYHVCNLDPLKTVVLRALSSTLLLPVLGSLRARYVAGRELAADRRAVERCGRRPLAGALLTVAHGVDWKELHVAAPIGGHELLDARVAQLEGRGEPRLAAIGVVRVVTSLLIAAAFAVAYVASVSSFGSAAAHRLAGAGLADATIRGGLSCAAPLAVFGVIAYLFMAARARRPRSEGAFPR